MFLDSLKDFFIKRKLNNSLTNVKYTLSAKAITTIGIIIGNEYEDKKTAIVAEIAAQGINEKAIHNVVFSGKIKNENEQNDVILNRKQINWSGEFIDEKVLRFQQQPFDLLINYYIDQKAPLILLTHNSQALFKVGFDEADKRLNHLIIKSNPIEHKVFINELFKYLKLLNKI